MEQAKKKKWNLPLMLVILGVVGTAAYLVVGSVAGQQKKTSSPTVTSQQQKSETYADKMKREDAEFDAWSKKKTVELQNQNSQAGN